MLAKIYVDEIGYRLPHIHEAAAAVFVASSESEVIKPVVHYPQEDENGLSIVY